MYIDKLSKQNYFLAGLVIWRHSCMHGARYRPIKAGLSIEPTGIWYNTMQTTSSALIRRIVNVGLGRVGSRRFGSLKTIVDQSAIAVDRRGQPTPAGYCIQLVYAYIYWLLAGRKLLYNWVTVAD